MGKGAKTRGDGEDGPQDHDHVCSSEGEDDIPYLLSSDDDSDIDGVVNAVLTLNLGDPLFQVIVSSTTLHV